MDTIFAIARRVIVSVLVFVVGVCVLSVSPVARAGGTQSQALANCQQEASGDGAGYTCAIWTAAQNSPSCTQSYCSTTYGYKVVNAQGQAAGGWYQFDGSPAPSNPCSALTSSGIDTTYVPGVHLGTTGRTAVVDPSSGATVWCPYTITWGAPDAVADAYGHLHIHATLTYTGDPGGSVDGTPPSGPQFNDPSGQPAQPQPSTSDGPSPTICGSGSCYDPNTDQYCGTSGGQQFCVSGSQASSSQGGCASGGGATLCAGSPSAPKPDPSKTGVTDPSTQISSSDGYTQSNISTGATSGVTVNTYGTAGSSPSSGSTSTSVKSSNTSSPNNSQPASSSTAAKSDSYGGGGDCNTPPVCQGDAVLCGVTLQQWRTMCSAHTDMQGVIGDGKGPPTFQQDQTKYSQSDVWQAGSSSTDGSVGGQANSGNYDSSGFGYNTTCPLQDLNVPFGSGAFVVPFSEGCVIGPWLRAVIIGFALFSAAVITAGGRG